MFIFKPLAFLKSTSLFLKPTRCMPLLAALFGFNALPAQATIVQFQTVAGNFEVNLLDNDAPITVQNFLDYIESEAFDGSVIHRSIDGFIIQGGGYKTNTDDDFLLDAISTNGNIDNEAHFSNTRGTIAMAKIQGDPDSASSGWFINVGDNSNHLDYDNGGFTVFGYVISPGMEVVDSINDYTQFSLGNFSDFPLVDYTVEDAQNDVPITDENLVVVQSVVIIDASDDTADGHNLNVIVERPDQGNDTSSEGAGSFNWLSLSLLGLLALARRKKAIKHS
ncbi:Peptidyl-prolyl cis-trans isomerase A [Thalassocella blandensis]|nr:Peptidyl-prolyl cis-trans isomerase A [Thalassocella blandensis]